MTKGSEQKIHQKKIFWGIINMKLDRQDGSNIFYKIKICLTIKIKSWRKLDSIVLLNSTELFHRTKYFECKKLKSWSFNLIGPNNIKLIWILFMDQIDRFYLLFFISIYAYNIRSANLVTLNRENLIIMILCQMS